MRRGFSLVSNLRQYGLEEHRIALVDDRDLELIMACEIVKCADPRKPRAQNQEFFLVHTDKIKRVKDETPSVSHKLKKNTNFFWDFPQNSLAKRYTSCTKSSMTYEQLLGLIFLGILHAYIWYGWGKADFYAARSGKGLLSAKRIVTIAIPLTVTFLSILVVDYPHPESVLLRIVVETTAVSLVIAWRWWLHQEGKKKAS